jgi:hypothetical protein
MIKPLTTPALVKLSLPGSFTRHQFHNVNNINTVDFSGKNW